jgi:two-component system, NtrC family, sensor kinase
MMSAIADQELAEFRRAYEDMRRERDSALAALERRNTEYGERIEHQAATIDVLKVMSAFPGDPQPVFDLIARQAAKLCSVPAVAVATFDGTLLHLAAQSGFDPAYADAYVARFPRPVGRDSSMGRAILNRRIDQVEDIAADPTHSFGDVLGHWSVIAVPMLREGMPLGAITLGRPAMGPFSDSQVALLQTFAEQAVIAISSAETYRELQERTAALAERNSEYGERIEHQSATIEVLKAMSASPGDAQPVFDLIVRHAPALCSAPTAALFEYDGELVHVRASHNIEAVIAPGSLQDYWDQFPMAPTRASISCRAIMDRQIIHIRDMQAEADLLGTIRSLGHRSQVSVPMLRDRTPIGAISIGAREPGGFTDSQIELLQTFAEQAVIAITSAETYRALQERIEHQSATIDVLRAMSASADDPEPVFELIARRACEVCNAPSASVLTFDGKVASFAAAHSVGSGFLRREAIERFKRSFPRALHKESVSCRAMLERRTIHIRDVPADPDVSADIIAAGQKSNLAVPLLRDGTAVGAISLSSDKLGGFSDTQVALLETFAEQAAIAVTGAETYKALQTRTAELTRSVGELQALEEVLRAVNSSLELATVLQAIIDHAVRLSSADEGTIYEFDESEQFFIPRYATGMSTDWLAQLRNRRIRIGETPLGRSAAARAPLHIPDLAEEPDDGSKHELMARGVRALLAVPLLREDKVIGGLVIRRYMAGGFGRSITTLLQTFAGQCVLAIENARLFSDAERERTAAETALAELRRAQDQLVQSEKMASLGQLTAGIAHEIKNPLNFVNNFAILSVDLLDELKQTVAPSLAMLDDTRRAEVDDLTSTLASNLDKINEHGRRADGIVRGMLEHSRGSSGERREVELNALVDEALNLAYHGARAQDQSFSVTLQRELGGSIAPITLAPQDVTRVLLNLLSNGFYAARERQRTETAAAFEPIVKVSTRELGDAVEIMVRDNGIGIPDEIRERLFQPFFTTKPPGEGTGLGLSMSYDIITQQHGGSISVESKVGEYSEFTVRLPRSS